MAEHLISLEQLDSDRERELVLAALKASARAYAPYSGFAAGAAIRMRGRDTIYTGANFENASYGVTMCAEVSAFAQLHFAGAFDIEAIAVIGHRFREPVYRKTIVTPCGRCRQLIAEVAQQSDMQSLRVLCCSGDLQILPTTIERLLPHAFGPANLGFTDSWPATWQRLQDCVQQLLGSRPKQTGERN